MKLTEHFTLEEFTRSATASKYGINNTPNEDQIANLKALCENVLEPLRQHFNVPIIIGSGYRCPQVNNHPDVRGATNSQHMTGQAADIVPRLTREPVGEHSRTTPTAISRLKKWFVWIMDNCDFDQLILEHSKNGTYWIHVSCKRDRSKNRHHVIQNLLKP